MIARVSAVLKRAVVGNIDRFWITSAVIIKLIVNLGMVFSKVVFDITLVISYDTNNRIAEQHLQTNHHID